MGKSVLFLNREFYIYDKEISQRIKAYGYNVVEYSICPHLSNIEKLCNLLDGGKSVIKKAVTQQKQMIAELKASGNVIDIVFVLAGQMLRKETLDDLKCMYPNAKFVWYMWDNTEFLEEFATNKEYFDTIISFDMIEAAEKGLRYSPLFYIEETTLTKEYDLSFVGTNHTNRLEIINRIVNENNFSKVKMHLTTTKSDIIKNYLFNRRCKAISFLTNKTMPYKDVMMLIGQSKMVLDLPASGQCGLTMRTIEALGAHSKLVTTNIQVSKYDFYNPNNIYIIDPSKIIMPPKEFAESDYSEVERSVLTYYSLDSWIERLVNFFEE